MKPELIILYTGGTLGMQAGERGLMPSAGLAVRFQQALADTPGALALLSAIEYTFLERSPLLDSANMTPADWESIAADCLNNPQADGLVIIHGTDTLAYTASALAYLLADINIPVIVTGSQIPLGGQDSDALGNLLGAMVEAAQAPAGTWVYFHQQLFPAARVVKKDALSFDGFAAPRYHRSIAGPRFSLAFTRQANARAWSDVHVATLHMTPGYPAQQLEALLKTRPRAIIVSLYGQGTFPDLNIDLLQAFARAQRDDIIIVAVTQCYIASIDFDIYATGHQLKQLGLLSALDMTLEAAYCKLMLLFRMGYSVADIKQLFVTPIANDMTPKTP